MDFCKCGSMIINGNCSNKSCSNRLVNDSPSKGKKTRSKASVIKKDVTITPKSTKVPRASKCITYSINDLPKNEE